MTRYRVTLQRCEDGVSPVITPIDIGRHQYDAIFKICKERRGLPEDENGRTIIVVDKEMSRLTKEFTRNIKRLERERIEMAMDRRKRG